MRQDQLLSWGVFGRRLCHVCVAVCRRCLRLCYRSVELIFFRFCCAYILLFRCLTTHFQLIHFEICFAFWVIPPSATRLKANPWHHPCNGLALVTKKLSFHWYAWLVHMLIMLLNLVLVIRMSVTVWWNSLLVSYNCLLLSTSSVFIYPQIICALHIVRYCFTSRRVL